MLVAKKFRIGRIVPRSEGFYANARDIGERRLPSARAGICENAGATVPARSIGGRTVNWITIAGSAAALCSMASFVPQAWRIVKSRDTGSISPVMYSFTVAGFALWTLYGIGLGEWPLIVTNSVCLLLASFILVMTLLPQAKKDAMADTVDPNP
ncbi:SemiSWEET family sugar transporter [Bosea sp. NPDC055332]